MLPFSTGQGNSCQGLYDELKNYSVLLFIVGCPLFSLMSKVQFRVKRTSEGGLRRRKRASAKRKKISKKNKGKKDKENKKKKSGKKSGKKKRRRGGSKGENSSKSSEKSGGSGLGQEVISLLFCLCNLKRNQISNGSTKLVDICLLTQVIGLQPALVCRPRCGKSFKKVLYNKLIMR